jgi:hypothetical protein
MPRSVRRHTPTHADGRPLKIAFGEMREMGLRGILVHCHCGHHVALSADRWADDVRLSELEPRLTMATAPLGREPQNGLIVAEAMRTHAHDQFYSPLFEPDIIHAYRAQFVAVFLICILLVGIVYIVAYLAAKRPEHCP